MKVKLLISMSGAKGSFSPGDEVDVSEQEAARMIERGYCTPIEKRKKETAAKKAAKNPFKAVIE